MTSFDVFVLGVLALCHDHQVWPAVLQAAVAKRGAPKIVKKALSRICRGFEHPEVDLSLDAFLVSWLLPLVLTLLPLGPAAREQLVREKLVVDGLCAKFENYGPWVRPDIKSVKKQKVSRVQHCMKCLVPIPLACEGTQVCQECLGAYFENKKLKLSPAPPPTIGVQPLAVESGSDGSAAAS